MGELSVITNVNLDLETSHRYLDLRRVSDAIIIDLSYTEHRA